MSNVTILTSLVEERESASGITMVKLSGEPHAAAIVNAVASNYDRFSGRPRVTQQTLEEMVGQKVTLVQRGENMLAAGMIVAQEGKLFESSRGLGILPKGKRTKGYRVDPDKVLDVFEGWVVDDVAQFVAEIRGAHYPELRNLTQERLEQLPRDSSECSLAVFGSNPAWGAPDCLWLIGEYWPDDDICETNVLLIRPEFGTSEPGSCWGADLLRNRAIGEVVGFEPISFSEAIELCNIDFDEAIERVFHCHANV